MGIYNGSRCAFAIVNPHTDLPRVFYLVLIVQWNARNTFSHYSKTRCVKMSSNENFHSRFLWHCDVCHVRRRLRNTLSRTQRELYCVAINRNWKNCSLERTEFNVCIFTTTRYLTNPNLYTYASQCSIASQQIGEVPINLGKMHESVFQRRSKCNWKSLKSSHGCMFFQTARETMHEKIIQKQILSHFHACMKHSPR